MALRSLRSRQGNTQLFGLLVIGGIAIGFGLGFFVSNKIRGSTPKPDDVVAEYNGTGVTAQDAYQTMKNRIYDMESNLYQLKKKAISNYIENKLLEEEAKKAKMSVIALIYKNSAPHREPTSVELDTYIQSRGMNPKDRKIKKEDYRSQMRVKINHENREEYTKKLLGQAKVKYFIPEPAENKVELNLDGYASWGNHNAPVTIVEYSDFPCVSCGRNADMIEKLKTEYGPEKLKIIYAENPTPSNPKALASAIAARCANDQGKFWEMRTTLFQNPTKLEEADLKDYAKKLGLDTAAFNSCFQNKTHAQLIEKSKQQAMKQGILGLPSVVVNGTVFQGAQAYDRLREKVEILLKL